MNPEAVVDGLEGLTVSTPTGPVSIGGVDHHVRLMIDGSGNGTSEHGVQHHQRMVLEAMSRPA